MPDIFPPFLLKYMLIYIKNNETEALNNMGKNGNVIFKNLY